MRQKMSQWPAVFVRVPPEVYTRIEAEAEQRAVPMTAIVREVLRAYRSDVR